MQVIPGVKDIAQLKSKSSGADQILNKSGVITRIIKMIISNKTEIQTCDGKHREGERTRRKRKDTRGGWGSFNKYLQQNFLTAESQNEVEG